MERDFKGIWIPAEIWLNENLSTIDKCILAEIDSLDNENGCSASNEYLADFCKCSECKVSLAIRKLIDLGYIYIESFNGRVRILKSRLLKNQRQTFKNSKADFENLKAIKIDNNIYNNKENIIKENSERCSCNQELIKEIISYLNYVTDRNYSVKTKETITLLNARIREKHTLEEFKKVIDFKASKWLHDDKMREFLRPATLFSTKFERYLEEAPKESEETLGLTI